MKSLEERIFDVMNKPFLASLATINKDGKPWVRYVMALGAKDFTIRFSTVVNLRKVKEIQDNPEVHITCGVNSLNDSNPYLQIQGRATVVDDQREKDGFWNDELKNIFTGPDDPNYLVVIVKPYLIEYNMPQSTSPAEIWTKN